MGRVDAGARRPFAVSCRGVRDGLQLADVRRVLRARARAALDAVQLDDAQGQPARRELSLLRRVESAVRDPALGLDGRRLVRGAGSGQVRAADGAARVDAAVGRRQSRHARLLQVRHVHARELPRADGDVRRRLPAAGVQHRAAGRHLVLYVRDAVLHARRVPAPRGAGAQLPRLRAVRDVLPASRRRPDHASDRARAAVRRAAPRDAAISCASGSR